MNNQYVIWVTNYSGSSSGGVRYGWRNNLKYTAMEVELLKTELIKKYDKIEVTSENQ